MNELIRVAIDDLVNVSNITVKMQSTVGLCESMRFSGHCLPNVRLLLCPLDAPLLVSVQINRGPGRIRVDILRSSIFKGLRNVQAQLTLPCGACAAAVKPAGNDGALGSVMSLSVSRRAL